MDSGTVGGRESGTTDSGRVGGREAGITDSGTTDSGRVAGITDSGTTDSGRVGGREAGITDSGTPEPGRVDGREAGITDSGTTDSNKFKSGTRDRKLGGRLSIEEYDELEEVSQEVLSDSNTFDSPFRRTCIFSPPDAPSGHLTGTHTIFLRERSFI